MSKADTLLLTGVLIALFFFISSVSCLSLTTGEDLTQRSIKNTGKYLLMFPCELIELGVF